MNDKLKPCPFCGDVPRWCGENNKDPRDNHECHLISCDKCGVLFDVDNEETDITETMGELQNATKNAWNNRHCESTIKSQAETIEKLKKLVDAAYYDYKDIDGVDWFECFENTMKELEGGE